MALVDTGRTQEMDLRTETTTAGHCRVDARVSGRQEHPQRPRQPRHSNRRRYLPRKSTTTVSGNQTTDVTRLLAGTGRDRK